MQDRTVGRRCDGQGRCHRDRLTVNMSRSSDTLSNVLTCCGSYSQLSLFKPEFPGLAQAWRTRHWQAVAHSDRDHDTGRFGGPGQQCQGRSRRPAP